MTQTCSSFLFIAASYASVAFGQPGAKPELLPRDREIEMALAAAPVHLRAGAGIYVLETNGFVHVRTSSNGFTCLVHRDGPLNMKPTCWDKEGTETIVPAVLREGELLMKGMSVTEVQAELKKDFDSGKFVAARRAGVAYMLGENRNYNPQTKQVNIFPPHVMFYAPNLTNADIGSNGTGAAGMPFIGYEGPHGYMIVVPPSANAPANKPAAASSQSFSLQTLLDQRGQTGNSFVQFLNVSTMRMGVYNLSAAAQDNQAPHDQDEVYYITKGRAKLQAGDKEYSAEPGAILFVPAHMQHKFHSITEDLETVVFFAASQPAEHH